VCSIDLQLIDSALLGNRYRELKLFEIIQALILYPNRSISSPKIIAAFTERFNMLDVALYHENISVVWNQSAEVPYMNKEL
jgi:hypothetical protein